MDLPFTAEQFLNVFREYNTAIWPAQVVAYLLGLGAIGLSFRRTSGSDRLIGGVLAALWLWMGAVYHLTFFRAINQAAVYGYPAREPHRPGSTGRRWRIRFARDSRRPAGRRYSCSHATTLRARGRGVNRTINAPSLLDHPGTTRARPARKPSYPA